MIEVLRDLEEIYGIRFADIDGCGTPAFCRYNANIACSDWKDCKKCGWNPAVAKKRSEQIRKELNNG